MSFIHATVAERLRVILATNSLGVAVITEPDTETPRESFLVDFESTDFEFTRFKGGGAARPLSMTLTLRVGIETHIPGGTAVVTQARWFAMASAVMDLLRANPTLQTGYSAIASLQGITDDGQIRGPFTGRLPDNSGWSCVGDVLIPLRTNAC